MDSGWSSTLMPLLFMLPSLAFPFPVVLLEDSTPPPPLPLDRSSWTASRFIPLCKHFIYLFRMEKNNNINIQKIFLVPISESWKWRIYLQYWHRFRYLLSTKQVLFSSNRKKGGKLLFLDLVVVYITHSILEDVLVKKFFPKTFDYKFFI